MENTLFDTAQTLNYMIAGYAVIFGFMGLYIFSLALRWQKAKENEMVFAEMVDTKPVGMNLFANGQSSGTNPARQVEVVLYCTDWCPDCRRARTWLKSNNISFTELNVEENPNAAKQLRAWANGNLSTPTFDIHGTVIVGFEESRLAELLLQ